MEIEFRSFFVRDAKKLSPQIKEDLQQAISIISQTTSFSQIPNVKALKGGKNAMNAYRMKIKDYRICFYFENEVVELVRVLPPRTFISSSLNPLINIFLRSACSF